jgi:hypothetical protein
VSDAGADFWLASLVVHRNLPLRQKRLELRQSGSQFGIAGSVLGCGPQGELTAGGHLTGELRDYRPPSRRAWRIAAWRGVHIDRLDTSILTAQAASALSNAFRELQARFVALLGNHDAVVGPLAVV